MAQKCPRNFGFTHGNFSLLKAISICSRQFQFAHGNFSLPTAISIYSRQFRNFTQGNFNFFYGKAHGIFRFSHLSATAADSGHAPKVKTQNQKSIYELAELGGIYMRLRQTQTSMSSYRSPYIPFHAFTVLKMNSDRSNFISVTDPTRVTFVPVWDRTVLIKKTKNESQTGSINSMFLRMAPQFLLFLSKNRNTATNNSSKQDLEVASMLGLMWGIEIEAFWDAVQFSGRKNVMSMRELFRPDPLAGFEKMAGFQNFFCLIIKRFHS